MTLIFNSEKYKEILLNYQPKIIRTEEENEKALTVVEELMNRQNRTPEEDEFYELLIVLIEKFEQEHYLPGKTSDSNSILNFLVEQRNIKEVDLVEIIGSEEVVAEIVNGKGEISKAQATVLGDFFSVNPELFT
ncbi:conserved hypothetical protein [Hyella patelloides LEGE 07179]|uniref:Transcription regulator with HTH domain n=1 Tax=Hyella patelloides LEGE 07179 TaxID=945734 RepID=A0A563W2L3_9CYAN|nr:transcriptional regulator [Hyella patelloides]VEP17949.1 conserved hypothetical protein [Hyella patelloides LEGE 07179]